MQRRGNHKQAQPIETVEAEIIEIGAKGDGVAIVNEEPLFVPYTAPGDLAVVERQGAAGRLKKLLRSGPDRAQPPCPVYGVCGGCALQHVKPSFYSDWKRDQVIAALSTTNIEVSVEPMIELPTAVRRRAQFYVQRNGKKSVMGFHQRRSRQLVPVETCMVLHPDLDKHLPALHDLVSAAPEDWPAFSISVT